METKFTTTINGKEFSISGGKIAKQASGSVIVQYGETIVLVTAVSSKDPKPDISFLPLTVEYQEKIYSAGRIPGNYFRREIGRPSEKETLTARLIDRPIRPLFEDDYNYETQVIATVLSMDKIHEPDTLAIAGASAALQISDIPFAGPIAGIKVGRINGQFVANPTIEEMEESDIELVVAGSKTGVVMVEGGADIVSEKDMLDAIFFGHEAMQPIIDLQDQIKQAFGKEKRVFVPPARDEELIAEVIEYSKDKIYTQVQIKTKIERQNALSDLKNQVVEHFSQTYPEQTKDVKYAFSKCVKKVSRDIVLKEDKRIDGRAFDEIRQITCEVGSLPRPHGSALFTRGETQVLGILTLGSGMDEQRVETLMGNETRAFMLHYNFPAFSVGEVRRAGGPSRRDIGHGNLATRALQRVLPSPEEFEYTIRLVGEVMESNGSSSMGTVCSGTLALMDGGVPIKAPVSGIAMGLVKDDNKTAVLSDILGDEDHFGDMDFKVAGTAEGITALQMDIKIKELSKEIMEKALNQANGGRIHILNKMLETLKDAREDVSPHAPKIVSIQIKSDKIRDIIGPGGKVIRALQVETNTIIEVNDSGIVKIAAENEEDAALALKMVSDIALDPEIGEIYEGTVVKITDFGAFVNIKQGTDGLVHISELANYRVKKVTDVVKEGDVIPVKVLDVTRDGKIKLSYKATKTDEK
ncbi:polyribonucleotide nucleotidyltransferase [Desulfobacula toluolica]|uniref:Polyribonucleotide nucleotidyltransferase n=1 Tax=Desulfobacula toluolica (strain DSM 7467 / Tol2) TaxID=651182 RepID=K0NFW4_DESTT|nr:polyribonucleotide nucleotidyltransferase [Desulfobacula toluolica]CCK78633.1 Pnp: polyribonucleotide nucleotidyltransferase (polynucleotide phosphorylase) [Desulfobacula toluolica Tol2]